MTWTMGAHVAGVAVDPATGAVEVLAYGVADEGGVRLNPAVVEGQVRGGVAQGLGGALAERFAYDEWGAAALDELPRLPRPGRCGRAADPPRPP